MMRILFLSRWYPYPPDNGSKIRVASLLNGLCERHDVTLISFFDPTEPPVPPPSLAAPAEVYRCPYHEFAPHSPRALAGFLRPQPRFLVDTHSEQMEWLIQRAIQQTRFDLVIASQLSMAAYWRSFRGVPAIFEEVELGALWPYGPGAGTGWAQTRSRLTWAKHKRFMARLVRRFACCTVASDVERALLATVANGRPPVHVVPNSVDTDRIDACPERTPDSLIFTGSLCYGPNHDAMSWFVHDVLPRVRDRVPGVGLTVTGRPGARTLPESPDLVLRGHVPDVRPLVASSAVSVAPVRTGGGTRLKILEAMAVRTPVVATTKAVEGLDVRDGEHLLVADDAETFAAAVVRLLQDPVEAEALAERAWQLCHHRYSAGVVIPAFMRVVDQAVAA